MSVRALAAPEGLDLPEVSLSPLRDAARRAGGLGMMALTATAASLLGMALAVVFAVGAIVAGVIALVLVAVLAVLFAALALVMAVLLVAGSAVALLVATASYVASVGLRVAAWIRGRVARRSAVELGVAPEDAVLVEGQAALGR